MYTNIFLHIELESKIEVEQTNFKHKKENPNRLEHKTESNSKPKE